MKDLKLLIRIAHLVLLSRQANEIEVKYWLNFLRAGGTRAELFCEIRNSHEGRLEHRRRLLGYLREAS